MFTIPLIFVVAGLLFRLKGTQLQNKTERVDADYTGDLVKNPEEESMYHYERNLRISTSKACKNFGALLIFWGIVWFIFFLLP